MASTDIELQLRYQDFDLNRHVNNVAFLSLLETARVQFSRLAFPLDGYDEPTSLSSLAGDDRMFIVTDQYIEYQRSIEYRTTPITVRVWVSRVGNSSYDLSYEVREPGATERYAIAFSGMLVASESTGRPVSISDAQRALLESLRSDPLEFRRF